MALHNKECPACGEDFTSRWKNTVYCYPCRILKEWEYAPGVEPKTEKVPGGGGKTRLALPMTRWNKEHRYCPECAEPFWPLRRKQYQCFACLDRRHGRREEYECNRCGKHNAPAPGMEATCWTCVTDSHESRDAYIRALKKRRKALRSVL